MATVSHRNAVPTTWGSVRWPQVLSIAYVAAFFLRFCAIALPAHFAPDEIMNIWRHWQPGPWKLALANLTFWSKAIRPMGGILYYVPLYELFGLNPRPFTVVRLGIILISAFAFYRLATRFTGSRAIALTAAVPLLYHAAMPEVAYQGSFIYDLLCGCFYFAALGSYLRTRLTRSRFTAVSACLFLALYICALNAKEMAVSLPVAIVAWELLYRTPQDRISRLLADAWPALASIAITIVYNRWQEHRIRRAQ